MNKKNSEMLQTVENVFHYLDSKSCRVPVKIKYSIYSVLNYVKDEALNRDEALTTLSNVLRPYLQLNEQIDQIDNVQDNLESLETRVRDLEIINAECQFD